MPITTFSETPKLFSSRSIQTELRADHNISLGFSLSNSSALGPLHNRFRNSSHSFAQSSVRDPNGTYRKAQGLGVDPNIRGLRGDIGYRGDRRDWYKFAVTGIKTVNIEIRRLNQDVDLFLFSPLDLSNPIARSNKFGRAGESITLPLRAGTYYIELVPFKRAKTEYRLRLSTR